MTEQLPGGAAPTPPASVVYRLVHQDGEVLGALWAPATHTEGMVPGGATTHRAEMHPRLAWLSQYLRSGDPGALDDVAAMSGARWHCGPQLQADSVDQVRQRLLDQALLEAPADAPVEQAATPADPPVEQAATPADPPVEEAPPAPKPARKRTKKAVADE